MTDVGNDRWEAAFTPDQLGTWEYTVRSGVDRFQTWLRDLKRRLIQSMVAEDARLEEISNELGEPTVLPPSLATPAGLLPNLEAIH